MTDSVDPSLPDGSEQQDAQLLLLLSHERNRELLAEWLGDAYSVETGDAAALSETTLCLVDEAGFLAHREAIREWKESQHPLFAPVLLVAEEPAAEGFEPEEWQDIDGLYIIDEVVAIPAEKSVMYRRLENLLERRQLSASLTARYERSEQRFSSLFHATPDPAFLLDAGGTVRYVNDALCARLGLDRETLLDDPLTDIDGFDDGTVAALQDAAGRAMAGESVDNTDIEYEPGDGATRHAELSVRATTVDGQRGAVVVLHDVTERVERERELRAQNERLDEFASVVSHDLRNPLQVIDTNIGVLRTTCDDTDRIDTIEAAADRMERLIDDLLTLARQGESVEDPEPVRLAETVVTAWNTVDAPDASLSVDLSRALVADESRLRQLLENLFRNAVEHGGSAVTVGETDDGFYVADDGPGIPPEDRERVFEAGFSTREEGTGFGLQIVADIVDAHGWEITVTDSESGGARFAVTGVDFV